MSDLYLSPLAGLLTAIQRAHQRELTELAARADEMATQSTLGGPWTITPGTDALAAMHPHLVIDFTQDPAPTPTTGQHRAPAPPRAAAPPDESHLGPDTDHLPDKTAPSAQPATRRAS